MKRLILTYHNVVSSGKDLHLYDVSMDTFRQQMKLLKSQSHKVTKSQEIFADCYSPDSQINTKKRDTHHAQLTTHGSLLVTVTFDDGYPSWSCSVLDILKENGLEAYFFVCVEFVKNGNISEKDIIKLKDNGMVIGSHGMSHRFLHRLSEEELFYELGESKKALEDIIQDRVEYFSIPRGVYDKRVLKVAKDVGYKHIFTSDIGINIDETDIFKRIPITRDTSIKIFENIINGVGINKLSFQQKIKDSAKKIMGIRFYNWAREKVVVKAE